ncbi:MAG: glycoside hydrolase family 43 protein [Clostridia bacterium]|nr:glycoside hydrolase family 43 protein [Clostridia bacterium]
MPYLFAHFKEKWTPDGEQVYFALSRDGLRWETLNGGAPILTCTTGDGGCRDIEIVRLRTGGFVLLATDLCIVRHMDAEGRVDWRQLNHAGSRFLSCWRSDDLLSFSDQTLLFFGREDFGCLWAPEVFFDESSGQYLIHWSATVRESDFEHMAIWCCTTEDFCTFSPPKLFFSQNESILDSHLVKHDGVYHLFFKHGDRPAMNMHAVSDALFGPYRIDNGFSNSMAALDAPGAYEAPTTFVLPDGRWCLLLDFFGCEKEKMGYVPFLSPRAGDADFTRAKAAFSFPYGFKHGRVLEITPEEYARLKAHDTAR